MQRINWLDTSTYNRVKQRLMTAPTLYLDFDGVLNATGASEPLSFVPQRCQALNHIVQSHRLQVVVSSSWRFQFDEPALDLLLRSHGINSIGRASKTEQSLSPNRAAEILAHVNQHEVQTWVALDDMPLQRELPPGHFCQSHPQHGPDWDQLNQLFQTQLINP